MSEASDTAALLRAAAEHVKTGVSQLNSVKRDLTSLKVDLNNARKRVLDALTNSLGALQNIRQGKEAVSASAVGTANRAVLAAVQQLQQVDDTLVEDIQRLSLLKRQLDDALTALTLTENNFDDNIGISNSAVVVFEAYASALE